MQCAITSSKLYSKVQAGKEDAGMPAADVSHVGILLQWLQMAHSSDSMFEYGHIHVRDAALRDATVLEPAGVMLQVSHVAYSADSMSLFGDIYLRDDEQLNWKPGMLEFNFHLTEVPHPLASRGRPCPDLQHPAYCC